MPLVLEVLWEDLLVHYLDQKKLLKKILKMDWEKWTKKKNLKLLMLCGQILEELLQNMFF